MGWSKNSSRDETRLTGITDEGRPAMAIAAYFHPKNMTLEQFNEIHQRLEGQARNRTPIGSTTPASAKMATSWSTTSGTAPKAFKPSARYSCRSSPR